MDIKIFALLALATIKGFVVNHCNFRIWIVSLTLLLCTENVVFAQMSESERLKNYEKSGMSYAKDLWQRQDNSQQDDKRSQKGESLSYQVRERTIKMTEKQLERAQKNATLKQEIYFRLGLLEEQQAESSSRKQSNGNALPLFQKHTRKSIFWREKSLSEFPKFKADALLFSLGESYGRLLDLKNAEAKYQRIVREFKSSKLLPDALLAVGNINFDRKGFSQARALFSEILSTSEESLHAYAHYKIAWCFFNESKYTEAMTSLENAVAFSKRLGSDLQQKRLGVEDEALSDLVLFYSEYANPNDAKSYFEKVIGIEKGRELRIRLAKRYFDQGQHENAKTVARALLNEGVPPKENGQLLLVLLSVAEKTKDLSLGETTAKTLAKWIGSSGLDPNDPVRADTEEYLRSYCLRAHYAAETIKKKELWQHAKIAYETFLAAFTNSKEAAEVQFRYGGLLFQMKDNKAALYNLKQSIVLMKNEHPRLKEALQLRIQSIEMASKEQRKEIADTELLSAYDDFVKFYPQEKLSPEAAFKAAELAKKIESPDLVAARFRGVAEKYPDHELAKSAISNSLSVLVQSGNWSSLKTQSANLSGTTSDSALKAKISEVKELAEMKLVEEMEQKGAFAQAYTTYEKLIDSDFSENFVKMCLVRSAHLAEDKLKNLDFAKKQWETLRKKFPDSNESAGAILEIARIAELQTKPENE
jgi:TolA-binding protein